MTRGVFVTGTDTGVGKTRIAAALVRAMNAQGIRGQGMKPVAAGCTDTPQGLRNDDALALIAASGANSPRYELVNRYALPEPVAPHLAALRAGVEIDISAIVGDFERIATDADCVVVEGVGGWAVPLTETWMQADLARALGLPVLLVVGVRLGCINHALLTAAAITAEGLELAGWIANRIDPEMSLPQGSIAAIAARLGRPPLADLPWTGAELPDPHALETTASLLAVRG